MMCVCASFKHPGFKKIRNVHTPHIFDTFSVENETLTYFKGVRQLVLEQISVTPCSVSPVFVIVFTHLQVSPVFPISPWCIYPCVSCLYVPVRLVLRSRV